MRPYLRFAASVVLLAGLPGSPCSRVLAQLPGPTIDRVDLSGKRLLVTGANFDMGAVIEIDGREVATRSPADAPTEKVIAKKGGKWLAIGERSMITVRDSDGRRSTPFFVFRTEDFIAADVIALLAPLVNTNFHGAFLSLKPGDYFIVDLSGISGASLVQTYDPLTTLEAIVGPPFNDSFKFLYRVKNAGIAQLTYRQHFDSPGDVQAFELLLMISVSN